MHAGVAEIERDRLVEETRGALHEQARGLVEVGDDGGVPSRVGVGRASARRRPARPMLGAARSVRL
jgi:hypothetical protein